MLRLSAVNVEWVKLVRPRTGSFLIWNRQSHLREATSPVEAILPCLLLLEWRQIKYMILTAAE